MTRRQRRRAVRFIARHPTWPDVRWRGHTRATFAMPPLSAHTTVESVLGDRWARRMFIRARVPGMRGKVR
jgi:hypothetical protein